MSFRKTTRMILFFSFGFLVAALVVSAVLYTQHSDRPATSSKMKTRPASGISDDQSLGKKTFNQNCAACHKLDSKANGPALRNIDSTLYFTWLTKAGATADTTKVKEFGMGYHRYHFSETLDSVQIQAVYEYTQRVYD